MYISDDTNAVVNFLNDFTNGNLRKLNDFAAIIELSATFNGIDVLNRLIFTSKIVWNVYLKIKRITPTEEGINLLESEMERSIIEMLQYLKVIIEKADDDDLIIRFNDVYFQNSRGSILNLIDLAHDFAKFKDLQMLSKQNRKSV